MQIISCFYRLQINSWLWSQTNIGPNECGLKWTGLICRGLNCLYTINFIHLFIYFNTRFSLAVAVALWFYIPHGQQQFLILLLSPKDGTKQSRRCSLSTWSSYDLWVARPLVLPAACLPRAFWSRGRTQRSWNLSIRKSGLTLTALWIRQLRTLLRSNMPQTLRKNPICSMHLV